jgi:hypothetical protein
MEEEEKDHGASLLRGDQISEVQTEALPSDGDMQPSCDLAAPVTVSRARTRLKHTIAALACIPAPETLESRNSSELVSKCLREIEDLIDAVQVETRNAPPPPLPRLDHYWTPDPTKRFCVICGDNGLGSVWGVHRFQIQPHDPDFKTRTGSGNQATKEHADATHRSAAQK